MTEISVIIPAYNQAKYITEAIRSVHAQTFTNWELIVVNDGSTDDTARILADLKDPRILVITQANKGVSTARNVGLQHSSAPLVTFLDADDLVKKNQMSLLRGYLVSHPEVGLVVGRMERIDSSGRVCEENPTTPGNLQFPGLLLENDIPLSGVMVRREWLERAGGFDPLMFTNEDWDLWLRMVLAGCQFSRVDQVVVAYRIHTGQVTQNMAKMRTGTLGLWKKFFNLPNLPPNLLDYRDLAFASALVRTSARAFRIGEFEMGNLDLLEAVKLDPTLTEGRYKRLADLLRGWANDPQTQDPEVYLIAVSKHVTPKLPGLNRQLKKVTAAMILEPLFGASQHDLRTHRKVLAKAVFYDPAWLTNRGVLRMLVKAWFPLPPARVM